MLTSLRPDTAAALRDSCSTTASLGTGLGTCLRTADDFGRHSTPERGTIALAGIAARPNPDTTGPHPVPLPVRSGGVNIPLASAAFSGDARALASSAAVETVLCAPPPAPAWAASIRPRSTRT
ncbi:hypothetical protein [Streptomyces regalis]|uniref:Uncharacterized protein n=1 Tax=Streptomyces regalis TaxID=68262 RepID=A0A117MJR8_9ACTN|nr:hypothetical protein [Streptomyces regalis]KUL21249.1 hypothetical protein ADL12_46455 [Streptomyces regalis]